MISLYFSTPTKLDPKAFLFMGVSVKDSPSAIGQFGTGLKYAVAWLLRNSHEVIIDGQPVEAKREVIRGKEFRLVHFNGKPAGFTTDLGPKWEAWMAFRELYANTLDEGGDVSEGAPAGWPEGTTIEVRCPQNSKFLAAFRKRDTIILPQELRSVETQTSVIEALIGRSKYLFVRGIRAFTLPKPSIFTWNHFDASRSLLTEDRTLSSLFTFVDAVGDAIATSRNEVFLREVLTAPKGTFEGSIDPIVVTTPSEEFLKVASEQKDNPNLVPWARKLLIKHIDKIGYTKVELDPCSASAVDTACRIASKVVPVSPEELNFTEDFGYPILGQYIPKTNEIWISVDAVRRGLSDLTATVLEEAIHAKRKLLDESRSMQEFLLLSLVNQLMKEDRNV